MKQTKYFFLRAFFVYERGMCSKSIPQFSILFQWTLGLLLMCLLGGCEVSETPQTMSPYKATSRPYKIKGRWYYPQHHYEYEEVGVASYYGGTDGTHGLPTATGEKFCMFSMTAAHKTLPLPCIVLVTNLNNGKQVILKVNDRGPFKDKRILDVSAAAAHKLGFYKDGVAPIHLITLVEKSLALPENQRRSKARRKRMRECLTQNKPPRSLDILLIEAHKSARKTVAVRAPSSPRPLRSLDHLLTSV
jgi:rare lipoprotein A